MTEQLSILDVCARRHGGDPQSAEAFRRGNKAADRERVYAFIVARGAQGATLDEYSEATGRPPNALSGRFRELFEAKRIYKTLETRPTRTGSPAKVYRAYESRP